MLSRSVLFLVAAVLTGVLAVSGITGTASVVAQLMFIVFLILFAIASISNALRKQ